MYLNFLQICLFEPNCMNFETWGFTDKYADFLPSYQKPFPFDSDMKPKTAYNSMVSYLVSFPRDSAVALAKLA